jgi:ATPase subunit of ABC transporter with duplicated ATPase domains
MSSVNFAMADFCSLIPTAPSAWPAIFCPRYTAATLIKRHRAASCSFKMISFSNINKQYGKQLLFVDASFQFESRRKSRTGRSKRGRQTTLFRMVVGEETPEARSRNSRRDCLSFCRQKR